MRLPKLDKYDDHIEKELVELPELILERKRYNLDNDKERFKFISNIEKLCRQSLEYKTLIDYLKLNKGMDFCSFFHKISKKNFGKTRISVEIHHEPFTLYDIVAIVIAKRQAEDLSLDMHEIADEVMRLHYSGRVGLIPLSTTVHQLVHSGKFFIPLQYLDDGYNKFYQEYYKYIKQMDGINEMMEAKIRLSKEYADNPDKFLAVLKKRFIYVVNSDGLDLID